MKKLYRLLLLTACILTLLPGLPAEAAETEESVYELSGAGELYGSLEEDTKELLRSAGVDRGLIEAGTESRFFETFSALLRDRLTGPVKGLAALLAIVILCRLAACFDTGRAGGVVSLAGTLACAAVTAAPLLELIGSAAETVESASVFLLAAVPVYGALLAASGSASAGASYSFLTLAAGNAIPVIASAVVFPLLHVLLAMALVSAVSESRFDRFAGSLYNFAKWLLVLSVSVFSVVLSVQTSLNAGVDAAAGKAGKLAFSTAVPIVGGALGDAVGAILNSVQTVKSGVGAFGILAAFCIFAPVALETVLWSAVCSIGQLVSELFETPRLGAFFGMCASAARMLLAVLAAVCTVCIVSGAILIFTKGSI